MWENLGRVAAEYAHLSQLKCFGPGSRVEIHGLEHVDRLLAERKPAIYFGGHFSNWEVSSVVAVKHGMNYAQVYRAANNPAVEAFMASLRRSLGLEPIAKGAAGARRIIEALRSGKGLGMLVDQKMNDGIPVPFFGRDAMTAPAIAELALRYDCAMVPIRVDRVGGAHFRLICYPPMSVASGANRKEAVKATMIAINRLIEDWVREQPEQWFWLHRRWSD